MRDEKNYEAIRDSGNIDNISFFHWAIKILAGVSSVAPVPPVQPGGRGVIVMISAASVIVVPSGTVAMGADESDTQIQAFDEIQYLVLAAGLLAD